MWVGLGWRGHVQREDVVHVIDGHMGTEMWRGRVQHKHEPWKLMRT
jgi:hypothetical protein